MKFIVQCSSRKRVGLWTFNGQLVKFVGHPDQCGGSNSFLYCRPDDTVPYVTKTWRQELLNYNQKGTNPDGLLRAADLYTPEIYRELANKYGWENTFILSAGWGLVRADFLIPSYDITFSPHANTYKRRLQSDKYNDFNHLLDRSSIDQTDSLYFCGGNDYLPLYYELTGNLPERKVIYHKSKIPPREKGYVYIEYMTTQSTNWHYACAKDFIDGELES